MTNVTIRYSYTDIIIIMLANMKAMKKKCLNFNESWNTPSAIHRYAQLYQILECKLSEALSIFTQCRLRLQSRIFPKKKKTFIAK